MHEPTLAEQYFLLSESKAVVVLIWLLRNRDGANNVFTTLDAIAEECKVTKVTVNRVFQKLYAAGFMKKVRNGHYQLMKI